MQLGIAFYTLLYRAFLLSIPASLVIFSIPQWKKHCRPGGIYYSLFLIQVLHLLPIEKILSVFSGVFPSVFTVDITNYEYAAGSSTAVQEVTQVIISNGISRTGILSFLPLAWAGGMLAYTVWHLAGYYRMCRSLKRWNVQVSDQKARRLFTNAAEKVSKKNKLGVKENPLVKSPMLLGLFSPTVILPEGLYDHGEEETALIFRHECIHYQRKDNWIKLIVFFINALFWFHPVIYSLSRQLDLYCEISCDEMVVAASDSAKRQRYGKMILKIAANQGQFRSVFTNHLYSSRSGMKKRMHAIMDESAKHHGIYAVLGAILFIMSAAVLIPSESYAEPSATVGNTGMEAPGSDNSQWFTAVYGKYGLTVNPVTGRLYFSGRKVRCFADRDESLEASAYQYAGAIVTNPDGEIDVVTVKDEAGKVISLKSYDIEHTVDYIAKIYE